MRRTKSRIRNKSGAQSNIKQTTGFMPEIKKITADSGIMSFKTSATYNLKYAYFGTSFFFNLKCFRIHLDGET